MTVAQLCLIAHALILHPQAPEGRNWGMFFPVPYEMNCRHCDKEATFVEVWSENLEGFILRQKRPCCESHICGS